MEILGTDYLVATLDFETFYGTKYSLTSMNTFEYVADPRFSIHGAGLKLDDAPSVWYRNTQEALDAIEAKAEELGKPVALVCQNTYFDGWILHACFDWHPDLYCDTMGMSRGMFPSQSASLENLCQRLWPNDPRMRKGKELVKFFNVTTEELYADPAKLKAMIKYCCGTAKEPGDVELTYAAFCTMLPFYPDEELELIHLTLQMMCEPMLMVDAGRVTRCRDLAIQNRDRIIAASGLSETLLSSNAQFERWLKANDIPVPMKDSPTKFVKDENGNNTDVPEKIPALGKSDLGFLALRRDYPQFEHVWAGRVAAKSVGEITRAERFLQTAEQTGGFMPVALIYYSAHCVPGDTEVLTPEGWIALQDWAGGPIAQVDCEQHIAFLPGEPFVGPEVDQWVVSDARYMPCAFTFGHKVPYLTHGAMKWAEQSAINAAQRSSVYVPVAGVLQTEGAITPAQMRVLAMVQADGSFCTDTAQGRQLTVFVKKPRKIERARALLTAAGVTFRELTFDSHPGYVRFVVAARDYPEWLTPERKFFGPWLLDSTPEAREALIQELRHWDGGTNGEVQWSYCTSVKTNAEWAVTLCHLAGRSASIATTAADNRGGYARGESYVVNIRQRNYAQVKRPQWRTDTTSRVTYCAKTVTGYWLARANGRIFVTGNTGRYGGGEKLNLQNLGRGSELRRSLCVATREEAV